MDWRYILALSLAVFFGCQLIYPDLPVEYYISSSCLPQDADSPDIAKQKREEFQAIIAGAEEWNKATCMEVFRYVGVSNDVWFTIEDLQDDTKVVYCVNDDENPDVNKIAAEYGGKLVAYSIADIFIRRNGVWIDAFYRNVEVYHQPIDKPPSYDDYIKAFHWTMAHEFGHQIGFSHNSDERGYSVMSPFFSSVVCSGSPSLLDIEGSNEVDGFCDWYACPPADTCSTRPAL